jgi:hypothetical protein
VATNAQPIGVIARLLDLSERRVQQPSGEGVIPKAERGHYDLVGAVRGYLVYLRNLASRRGAGLRHRAGTADQGQGRPVGAGAEKTLGRVRLNAAF